MRRAYIGPSKNAEVIELEVETCDLSAEATRTVFRTPRRC